MKKPISKLMLIAAQVADHQRGRGRSDGLVTLQLAWIAAALAHARLKASESSAHALDEWQTWLTLQHDYDLPTDAARVVWQDGVEKPSSEIRAIALGIEKLSVEIAALTGDPLDLLASQRSTDGFFTLHAWVTELCAELGEVEPGQAVLCPQDESGQLATSLGRRGARVYMRDMGERFGIRTTLLHAIDQQLGHRWELIRFSNMQELPASPTIVGTFPFGLKNYDPTFFFGSDAELVAKSFDRKAPSEVVGLTYLTGLPSRRLVLLAPQVSLFGGGQHGRVRRELINAGRVKSAAVLPQGSLLSTRLQPALLVIEPDECRQITLTDWDDLDLAADQPAPALGQELPPSWSRIVLGREAHPSAEVVSHDEVAELGYVLNAKRVRMARRLHGALPLSQWFEAIRPPVADKSVVHEAAEIGIPELTFDRWTAVMAGHKTAKVDPDRIARHTLQPNDVVLSTKGTIGKAAIVADSDGPPAVCSTSCIALRCKSDDAAGMAAMLLIFLRTALGRDQLDALASGATIQQVPLNTLLNEFRIPPFPADLLGHCSKKLGELRHIEGEIAQLESRLASVAKNAWPAEHQHQNHEH